MCYKVVKGKTRLMETRGLLSEVRTSLPQVEDAKKAAVTGLWIIGSPWALVRSLVSYL